MPCSGRCRGEGGSRDDDAKMEVMRGGYWYCRGLTQFFLTIHQQVKRYFSNQLKYPVQFLCVSTALWGITEIPPPPWDFAAENRRRGEELSPQKHLHREVIQLPSSCKKRETKQALEPRERASEPSARRSKKPAVLMGGGLVPIP
jgi:hypothetical protein